MKRLAPLLFLAFPCILTSCGLTNSMIQGPYRLLQSAGRTLSDASDTDGPATKAQNRTIEVALSK